MYHVYEHSGSHPADRLVILSDRDWEELSAPQRAGYRFRAGGFRTGLDAIVRLVELAAGEPRAAASPAVVVCLAVA